MGEISKETNELTKLWFYIVAMDIYDNPHDQLEFVKKCFDDVEGADEMTESTHITLALRNLNTRLLKHYGKEESYGD
jgi:hypothetical protein